jgi:hypothetical protein
MTRFHDLWRIPTRHPLPDPFAPDGRQNNLFPSAVAATPMHLWSSGDPVLRRGQRLLIGVATWCGYDMALLDEVEEALTRPQPPDVRVELFNTDDCQSPEAFEHYVPGVGEVFHTPAVGWWIDGELRERASGPEGRDIVVRVLGLDPARVQQQIETVLDRM